MKRIIFAVLLVFGVSLANYYHPVTTRTEAKEANLVVHEWGTFTSIAGKNGVALDWRPLNGPSDLPKFVYNENNAGGYRGTHDNSGGKGAIARVRMETPVIYFYTPDEMEVNVRVVFPEGRITEWYPQAGYVNENYAPGHTAQTFVNGINWGTIKLMPGQKENFLREAAYSHYYPARETDAAPIQVCNADKTKIEHEKFLFYRGVGNFDLPLTVRMEGKQVVLGAQGGQSQNKGVAGSGVVDMLVFERHGNRVGYTYVPSLAGETRIERPILDKTLDQTFAALEKTLIANGLYEKEAKAMVKTWADSWFEDGLRVFYVLPRSATDRILPLDINPKPKEIVRVLVGRTELITPEVERDVKTQVALLKSSSAIRRENARLNLKRHGRFYLPILRSILEDEKSAAVRRQIKRLIDKA